MRAAFRPALILLLALTLITGLAYPFAVTGVAQLVLPEQANGSLIARDGKVIGSALIAQGFAAPHYFQPRPSAAGEKGYDAAASSGSNLAPTAKKLVERVSADASSFREAHGKGPVPMDAVTTSGSGLDPHISPANAARQIPRVAEARGLTPAEVAALVERHTQRPASPLVGQPGVNVLLLNIALDERKSMTR